MAITTINPVKKETMYKCSMCSTPNSAAAGIVTSRNALARSDAISIGRRRSLSTHTPAKRPTIRKGRFCAATSTPIWPGVALSTSTAVRGRASAVTSEPKKEMVSPAQNLRKSGLCHRPVKRNGSASFMVCRALYLTLSPLP